MVTRVGVRKPNNAGLVVTTAGPDLLHTIPLLRTVKVVKVMWYNNTGALANIILGTVDNAVPAGWVPLFPTIACVNTFDGELEEALCPDIEFINDRQAGALGMTGSIWVQGSVAGILVRLEVEEFGA